MPFITATSSSRERRADRWRTIGSRLRLVAGKRVDLTRVISDVFALARSSAGLRRGAGGTGGKVILVAE